MQLTWCGVLNHLSWYLSILDRLQERRSSWIHWRLIETLFSLYEIKQSDTWTKVWYSIFMVSKHFFISEFALFANFWHTVYTLWSIKYLTLGLARWSALHNLIWQIEDWREFVQRVSLSGLHHVYKRKCFLLRNWSCSEKLVLFSNSDWVLSLSY